MSREIKFRFWDKERGAWFDSFDHYSTVFDPIFGSVLEICGPDGETWTEGITDRFIIEQFTELLDRNGKEIYEGDILQGRGTWPLEVFHGKYGWMIRFDDGGRIETEPIDEDLFHQYEPEVIGNIHENASLLEARTKEESK